MSRNEGRRRLRLAMAGLLGFLLAHNLVLLVYNQLTFDRWHRYAEQLPTLREIAASSKNPDVRRSKAIYYEVRDNIEGASLTMPRSLRYVAWWFERAGRVEVTLSDEDLSLTRRQGRAWGKSASAPRTFRVKKNDYEIRFVFRPDATRYVLAPVRGSRSILLIPAEANSGASSSAK